MLAADADPLLPVAASPCETPWRLERPRPAQRPRTRHILVLPHGRRVQRPRHLASATPPHRQASRNQPAGATAANISRAVSLSVRCAAHLARGTAQRAPYQPLAGCAPRRSRGDARCRPRGGGAARCHSAGERRRCLVVFITTPFRRDPLGATRTVGPG